MRGDKRPSVNEQVRIHRLAAEQRLNDAQKRTSRIKQFLGSVMVFIEAFGDHLLGDDRIGYAFIGFTFGLAFCMILHLLFF